MELLDELIKRQKDEGLSDRAFARKLGVSHVLWSQTKRGAYPIRFEILKGAAREYPTLADSVVNYLAQFDSREQVTA